jgi:uncharacterized cupredoxin-like copper-binding protein
MRKRLMLEVVSLVSLFVFAGAWAGDKLTDRGALGQENRDALSTSSNTHGANDTHEQQSFAFGRRGDAKRADRTIRIKALDTMRYDKSKLTVRAGETVRFIVTNAGKIRHEFVIGDAAEQHEHAKEMQSMHGMEMPDEANGVSLAPGETKALVWQFDGAGTVQVACHEPGHYEAGMVSRVLVRK